MIELENNNDIIILISGNYPVRLYRCRNQMSFRRNVSKFKKKSSKTNHYTLVFGYFLKLRKEKSMKHKNTCLAVSHCNICLLSLIVILVFFI